MRLIAYAAGVAATSCTIDWTRDDLETLCDPAVIRAVVEYSERNQGDTRGDGRAQRRQLVLTIAWLVNGFLLGRAAQDLADAQTSGDAEAMRNAEARATRLSGCRTVPWRRWPTNSPKPITRIGGVWPLAFARSNGMARERRGRRLEEDGRLIDALVDDACEAAGGLSLDEQCARIQAGTFRGNDAWARATRLATVLVVAQRIPLRANTFAQLERGMWRTGATGTARGRTAFASWEGAPRLEIPGVLMKSDNDFAPSLLLPEQVGEPAYEQAIRRPLLQVWFCDGGARDYCRTTRDPITGEVTRHDVPWLFPDLLSGDDQDGVPDDAAVGAEDDDDIAQASGPEVGRLQQSGGSVPPGMWTRAALSRAFGAAVLRHADRLCVDPDRLRELRGALGFHTVRRLFASFWAVRRLIYCCRMLDHADIVTTVRIYTSQDERTISLDVDADPEIRAQDDAQRAGAEWARLQATRDEAAALRQELSALRKQNEELTRAVAALAGQRTAA